MKKTTSILFFTLIILIVSSASAVPSLEVQKIDRGSIVISELQNTARFDFVINNKGQAELFEIYSLSGVSISPKSTFELLSGKTRLEILANPNTNVRKNIGFYTFEYQIKGRDSGIFKDVLRIKIVSIKDALEVSAEPLHPDDKEAVVLLKNIENTNIENALINIKSPFFLAQKIVNLGPYEEARIPVKVQGENLNKIQAGPYFVEAFVESNGKKAGIEGIIDYLEKEGTSIEETSQGIFFRKNTVTKTNQGNTMVSTEIRIKKGIISRLFTTNSPNPEDVERQKLSVYYVWKADLSPGESVTVRSTTNYLIPFMLAILIVLIGFFVKSYSLNVLVLQKKVSFVRTKGGELALKVSIKVTARKHVDKIQLIDSLPKMAKLYEKFGRKPDKIDSQNKRMFWNIERLNKGESRVYSYIIYSSVNIVGRFELPSAAAVFEREGKTQEVFSNKAFFARGESS